MLTPEPISRSRSIFTNKEWRLNKKGNFYLRQDKYFLVIFKKSFGYSYLVKNVETNYTQFSQYVYEDAETTKRGALLLLDTFKSNQP